MWQRVWHWLLKLLHLEKDDKVVVKLPSSASVGINKE